MNLRTLLEGMKRVDASDLHLKVGSPPVLRIYSRLRPLDHPPITSEEMRQALDSILPERLRRAFEEEGIADFAHELSDAVRFRVAAYHHRGHVSISVRLIDPDVPTPEELNLPETVRPLSELTHGMMLVTGITGSGKSTTLAALIGLINNSRREHIITIEDPIEFVHKNRLSIINQMEVGLDCPSFRSAVWRILRFDPDIILVGEIRSRETIEAALQAVDTGHLFLSTLHTSGAKETIRRILHFFDRTEEQTILDMLAQHLRAIISQRLLPRCDKPGLIPACEILLNIPIVSKLIREGRIDDIEQVLRNREARMQSVDVALALLVREKKIALEDAVRESSDEAGLRRMIRGDLSPGDRAGLVHGPDLPSRG
jgi:twitching motility protein PilT